MSMTRVIKLLVGQFAGIVSSLTFSAVDLKFHLIRKFSIGKVHHQVAVNKNASHVRAME